MEFEGSPFNFTAGEAMEPYRRIMHNGTSWVYADANDTHHAVTCDRVASGGLGTAWAANHPGGVPIEAATTLSAGAMCYAAADGKVGSTSSGAPVGIVKTAPLAAGHPASVIRTTNQMGAGTKVFTAAGSVTAQECGVCITNTGAAGAIAIGLPPATPGLWFTARVTTAQALRLDPNGTETISLPSNGVPEGAGEYIGADAAGETVFIKCDIAGHWSVYGYTGTWTGE